MTLKRPLLITGKEVAVLAGTSSTKAYRIIKQIKESKNKTDVWRISLKDFCDFFKVEEEEAIKVLNSHNLKN